jgi:hypothetical protein
MPLEARLKTPVSYFNCDYYMYKADYDRRQTRVSGKVM